MQIAAEEGRDPIDVAELSDSQLRGVKYCRGLPSGFSHSGDPATVGLFIQSSCAEIELDYSINGCGSAPTILLDR